MTRRLDISLVLPCYNESEHFHDSVRLIEQTLRMHRLRYELVFVEDKSTDQTADLVRKYSATHPHTKAVFHRKNMGRGRTVADGIRVARAPIVGYIDIDCEVSPIYIPAIIARMRTNNPPDIVIGERIYNSNWSSFVRKVLSVGYRTLATTLLQTKNLDTESGYKFFQRRKILPLLHHVRHPHWFWDTEVIVVALSHGLYITEQPVLFLRRTDKTSTVRIIPDTIEYIKNVKELRKRIINHTV